MSCLALMGEGWKIPRRKAHSWRSQLALDFYGCISDYMREVSSDVF